MDCDAFGVAKADTASILGRKDNLAPFPAKPGTGKTKLRPLHPPRNVVLSAPGPKRAPSRLQTQVTKAMTPTQLRHRKRVQAGLSTAGAVIGLSALGARAGGAVARRAVKDAAKGERIATGLERKTNTGLAVGAGVGSLAGLNSAAISRTEAGPKKPDSVHLIGKAADPLVRQYGLRGSPQGVDRAKRQQIWEARAKHLNRKRDRWDRTRQGANVTEQAGKAVATGVGALVGAHQLRESYKASHPKEFRSAAAAAHRVTSARIGRRRSVKLVGALAHGKPGFRTLATGAAAAGAAGGARQLRVHAQKKVRRYSSASGGVASGTANRMKDYAVAKSAFGVELPIAKSEWAPGRYAPASQLDARRRQGVRDTAAMQRGSGASPSAASRAATPAHLRRRGLNDLYHGHSARNIAGLGLENRLRDRTVPSKAHPNVHYNASTTPTFREAMDRHLDPALTRSLKHSVTLHHIPHARGDGGSLGSAIKPHKVNGMRGHIMLPGHHWHEDGHLRGSASAASGLTPAHVVNHELGHAMQNGRNPSGAHLPPDRRRLRNSGDEAHADARSGKSLYTEQGWVPSRAEIARAHSANRRGASRLNGVHPSRTGEVIRRRAGEFNRYHDVHQAVWRATRLRKSAMLHALAKADRRFNPAANTKPPLYLARHTPQAAALRTLKPAAPPAAAAIRNTLRATRIGR